MASESWERNYIARSGSIEIILMSLQKKLTEELELYYIIFLIFRWFLRHFFIDTFIE